MKNPAFVAVVDVEAVDSKYLYQAVEEVEERDLGVSTSLGVVKVVATVTAMRQL